MDYLWVCVGYCRLLWGLYLFVIDWLLNLLLGCLDCGLGIGLWFPLWCCLLLFVTDREFG